MCEAKTQSSDDSRRTSVKILIVALIFRVWMRRSASGKRRVDLEEKIKGFLAKRKSLFFHISESEMVEISGAFRSGNNSFQALQKRQSFVEMVRVEIDVCEFELEFESTNVVRVGRKHINSPQQIFFSQSKFTGI